MSEGYVYICRREKSASGLVKIGHTDNLGRRVAEFNRETGADSKMILEVAFACVADLRHSLERAAHRLGRKHRARGEWFRLSLDEAVETVRTAAAELGINAAICYKKDQLQEVTDRIRRQNDQEFAERYRQREVKAAVLASAVNQTKVDAQAAIAMQAEARLETHLHTPPRHDVAALAVIKEEEHKRALWLANKHIEKSNDALRDKFIYKLIMPLVAAVFFFKVYFHPDISWSLVFVGITCSIILGTIATMLTSSFFAEPLIFAFAKREVPVPADTKFPEVEAAHARREEAAKAASIAAWNERRDELTAARELATARLDAVTLAQVKLDTNRALDGLGSKVALSHEALLTKPYALIENILCKAYSGRNSADRSHKDMDDLLIASHATEFNNYMEALSPAIYDLVDTHLHGFDASHPASGISDAYAKATIARLTTGNRNPAEATALEDALSVYRNMISNLQEFVVMKGLETQATIDCWREPFPNYTPFYCDLNPKGPFGSDSTPGRGGFVREIVVACHGLGLEPPIISPLETTMHFGMNLVKRGETATITQALLNFARKNVPNFITVTGEKKPIWVVDKLASARTVKHVNVYTVTLADGGTSAEFYNRDQAKLYADAQMDRWITANPGLPASQSPVMTNELRPHERVFILPPDSMGDKNVLVIPENGINHTITFNEESEDGMAILASLTNCNKGVVQLHRAS